MTKYEKMKIEAAKWEKILDFMHSTWNVTDIVRIDEKSRLRMQRDGNKITLDILEG